MIDDARRVMFAHFFFFFVVSLVFIAKGAYELISIANFRFWPGLPANTFASMKCKQIEGVWGTQPANQQQIQNQTEKMTARKQGQQHMAA